MARFVVDALAYPIVQAPLAGGPSTPALAAAVAGIITDATPNDTTRALAEQAIPVLSAA